jgi:hypothetical protein
MALKMSSYALSMNIFACYYETHFHKKTIKDWQTKAEMVAHFGSYNFIRKKTKGNIQIVLAYPNKWSCWTNYWFYLCMCSDEDVTTALENDLRKAHILVSEMTPMEGYRLAEVLANNPRDTEAIDAFALTSRWQISRDVEEWIACESPPPSSETRFSDIERRDGYISRVSLLHCQRPSLPTSIL